MISRTYKLKKIKLKFYVTLCDTINASTKKLTKEYIMSSINNLESPYQDISNQDYTNAIVCLFENQCDYFGWDIDFYSLAIMEKKLKRNSQNFRDDIDVTIDYLS